MHRGHFRIVHGFIKDTGTVPTMIMDNGNELTIRPFITLDGTKYEYSSVSRFQHRDP